MEEEIIMNMNIMRKLNIRQTLWFVVWGFLPGCNVYDLNDLCCAERDVMHFKLEYDGRDYFSEQIHSMRYLVFGEDGKFVCKLEAEDGQLNRVKLDSLDYGRYTMLAVANLDDYGWFEGEAGKGLDELCFYAEKRFHNTQALDNGDPIYWGVGSFERVAGMTNSYVTYMSDIYASLKVRVDWEGVPGSSSDCYFQLEGVDEGYSLSPSRATSIGEQLFPAFVGQKRSVVVQVPLRQLSLDVSILSLRYTDSSLPRLHLWQDGVEIIHSISLEQVFQSWGWFADRAQVQDYGLHLLIKMDGSVVITPYVSVGVSDWVDGGTFG